MFNKFTYEITRFQYKNFNPTSTLNLNEANKKTFRLSSKMTSFLKIFYTILQE